MLPLLVLASTLALATPAPAREDPAAAALPPREDPTGRSLYQVEPVRDGSLIALGMLTVAIPYTLLNDTLEQRCPCDPAEVNALDRGVIGNRSGAADMASHLTVGLAVAVPVALDLLHLGVQPVLAEDLTVFAQVLWLNGALVTLVKYATQRPLPLTYAGDPGLVRNPGGYRAFYSGHTATTVAALTVTAFTLQERHAQRVWPWLMTAGVGASIGVELVVAGRHFYTDVLVGGLAGFAVGYLVPWLHLREREPGLVLLTPVRGGATLGYVRRF
jgi:membrane-associated phospholipid phosphatase